jgi:cytochrome c oxidase assembly factor CtaG
MRALIACAAAVAALFGSILPVAGRGAGADLIGPLCTGAGIRAGTWTVDLWITAPLFVAALAFLTGLSVLWGRAGVGHGVRSWQALAFAAGWLALFAALVSPLHHAGGTLFTAHMVEHELIMAVAAPLLVLARPGGAFLWAFPRRLRHGIATVIRTGGVHGLWRMLTRPLTATTLHGAAIWLWHAPPLFDDAVVNVALHRLQHVSFLVTAILFWWAVMRRSDHGAACGHVFVTMTHTGLLGALMALAPHVLYSVQTVGAPAWGLNPLEDQQLAGLVMWVPAGTVYAGAALAFMGLWISRSGATREGAGHALRA